MAKKTTRSTKQKTRTTAKGSKAKVATSARRRKVRVMVDTWASKQPTFAEIQTAAYLRWLATGDHHVDCWLAAERELTVTVKGNKR